MNRYNVRRARIAPLYSMSDGDDGGGGGGDDTATALQAQIDAAVEKATVGLKTKNAELLAATKQSKEALKAWEGLDATKVRTLLGQVENDEVLKLHTEGKHDEAYNKRMERERSEWQSKLEGLSTETIGYKTRAEKLEDQVRDLVIDQQVLAGFIKEKGLETAAPDVVLRAKAAFKIEDGVPIARDSKGEIIRGAAGAITIPEWIAARKVDCPHWFPGSTGAGAGGGGKGGTGSDLDAQMDAAAANGNMDLYRELRAKKKAGK